MKKISDFLLYAFAGAMLLSLLASGVAAVAYLVAIVIGGEVAVEICKYIYNTYFPLVIKFSSVFVGFGLLGMYLSKQHALSFAQKNDNECADERTKK